MNTFDAKVVADAPLLEQAEQLFKVRNFSSVGGGLVKEWRNSPRALVQIDDAVIRKIADPGRNSSCELGVSKLQLLS